MVARAEHLKRPEQQPQPGPQQQPQPGLENRMSPKPMDEDPRYRASEKLKGKVVDVVESGYLLNDKVIRFAKVVVGS